MCKHFVLVAYVKSECSQVRHSMAKATNFQLHVYTVIQVRIFSAKQFEKVQSDAFRMGTTKLLTKNKDRCVILDWFSFREVFQF